MEIARAKDGEVQQALAEAYERKTIPGNQVMAIRRIIEERNQRGKGLPSGGGRAAATRKLTATALVRTYQKETERQKLLVKKAALAQSRLIFAVNALRRLLADEHFVTLLRAEAMHTLPRPLEHITRLGMRLLLRGVGRGFRDEEPPREQDHRARRCRRRTVSTGAREGVWRRSQLPVPGRA